MVVVVVVVEDLKVINRSASASGTLENPGRNVKAKSGLPKAILNQGWGIFRVRVRLGQKLIASSGELIKVPPMYTSQRCPECGHPENGNRKTQANFRGLNCG
jgi:putative transposase